MSGSTHDDELTAFQAALARLTPTPDGINLTRLLFRAGQLSASRQNRLWPCATAASMMLAVALGAMLLIRPTPQPAERIVQVYVQPPPPAPPPEQSIPADHETPAPMFQPSTPAGESDYLRLRREVLANGLDALPPPSPWPAATPSDDSDILLDLPRGSHQPWLRHLKRSLQSGDYPS